MSERVDLVVKKRSMPGTREIRRRIKSVKNTGKITRAMEMISSVKMRKASADIVALRPYARRAAFALSAVLGARDIRERLPFFSDRSNSIVSKVAYVVVTSNRGLCGSFNAQALRRLRSEIESLQSESPGISVEFVSLGRKGDRGLRALPGDLIASFSEASTETQGELSRSVTSFLFDHFEKGRWDRVSIVYTDFVSVLVQKPRIRRVLPFFERDAEESIAEMGGTKDSPERGMGSYSEYIVEPSPESVLRSLLFRLVETQVLHAILESKASEEAARMVAMRNATDAAGEMADDLTLAFNQLRQARVTQEIAELSAGMAAVS